MCWFPLKKGGGGVKVLCVGGVVLKEAPQFGRVSRDVLRGFDLFSVGVGSNFCVFSTGILSEALAQTLEFLHGGTIWPVLSGQVPRLEAGSQQKAKWRGDFLFLQMTSKWRKGAVTSGWLKVFGERDWSRVN